MNFVKFVVFSALVCACTASIEEDFAAWAQQYGKTYETEEERLYRLSVFKENVAKIARLNAESISETYGLNAFSDRTHEELHKRFSARPLKTVFSGLKLDTIVAPEANVSALPKSFNWVSKGAVTSVKDQGDCGSCWAFGAVGTMEGQLFLKKGKLENLSEQNLVDCDHECQTYSGTKLCDDGCDGGMEPNAFQYVIKNNGINTLKDYPYHAKVEKCKFDSSKAVKGWGTWSYVTVKKEDDLRQYLYDHGPVSIGVHAEEWYFYSGGIFNKPCLTQNDHAVLLTGWGEDASGTPYWIIKNSWGESWGIKGYIHMIRGKNKCGMLEMMSQIHMK